MKSEPSSNSLAIIDAHCHIDLFPDPPALIQQIEAARIWTIAVTNAPFVFPHLEKLLEGTRYIRPAIGMHPELATRYSHQLNEFDEYLARTRYVGEIGLDYQTQDRENRRVQEFVFERILEVASRSGDKILTLHSRRAADRVISMIGDKYPGTCILHWFTGSEKQLSKAIEFGFYFSINPAQIKSSRTRKMLMRIPRERILTETDGPFVRVSGAPAAPPTTGSVVKALSEIWREEPTVVRQTLLTNLKRILTCSGA